MNNYYKPGCWNVICAVCGCKFKSDEIRTRWDGLLVCKNDYEHRHIMDFLRGMPERSGVPYSNPEPADVFIEINDILSSQGLADIGKADVAKADYIISI